MNLLVVNSEAGLREAEFYGDFIELCPQGWVAVGGGKWYLGAGRRKNEDLWGTHCVPGHSPLGKLN